MGLLWVDFASCPSNKNPFDKKTQKRVSGVRYGFFRDLRFDVQRKKRYALAKMFDFLFIFVLRRSAFFIFVVSNTAIVKQETN